MAKLENKVAKKPKGKKRKHTQTTEDEVAPKTLIVEASEEAAEAEGAAAENEIQSESTSKATKRKNKNKIKTKEKRSKTEDGDSERMAEDEEEQLEEKDAAAAANSDEDENVAAAGPTMAQLRESEKPENTKSILTVRQKKKQKHQERLDAQKDQSVGKERQRNEEYLRKWKHERADWKFEKLRQISVQQSVFELEKIGADVWPIALEYLSGSKGAAKDKITKLAEDVIDQLDKECAEKDEEARQAVVESVKYQRARDLLQSFD